MRPYIQYKTDLLYLKTTFKNKDKSIITRLRELNKDKRRTTEAYRYEYDDNRMCTFGQCYNGVAHFRCVDLFEKDESIQIASIRIYLRADRACK